MEEARGVEGWRDEVEGGVPDKINSEERNLEGGRWWGAELGGEG